jgi:hypothetical protein
VTEDSAGWSFASAREPATFTAAEESDSPQVEHAFEPPATLCGIPEEQVTLYRHLFDASDISACPRCREQAAAAPTEPCGQERLHDKVLTAAPGPLRNQLLDALRSGAKITIWVNGPASVMALYARPDRITHGAGAVQDLLSSGGRIGIARVAQPSGEFVVVMPEHEAPLIAFAAD